MRPRLRPDSHPVQDFQVSFLQDRGSQTDGKSASMPRYYVQVDGAFPSNDTEGEIYASVDNAGVDAIRFLAEILLDRAHEIHPGDALRVIVLDEKRKQVLEIKSSVIGVVDRPVLSH